MDLPKINYQADEEEEEDIDHVYDFDQLSDASDEDKGDSIPN